MNVQQAHDALTRLIAEGYGSLPLVVVDTRSGVSDQASSFSHQFVGARRGDGWESYQKPGTAYVAVFIG